MMRWILSKMQVHLNFLLIVNGSFECKASPSCYSSYYYSQYRYKKTFSYIHLRQQQELIRTGNIPKEHTWPQSFPDCTPALRMYKHYRIMKNLLIYFLLECRRSSSSLAQRGICKEITC